MQALTAVASLLALAVGIVAALYGAHLLLTRHRRPVVVEPFLSGHPLDEHAVSRFHARWYAVTLVFLAFDMEMAFMYPWARVVVSMGASAVVEMFLFLAILVVGVVYAWRQGALRWS